MAKKIKAVQDFSSSIDDIFAPLLEAGKKKFGDQCVFTGSESETRLVGLKLPALSLRYLLQSNVLPLSRMALIVGIPEACKSAFLYEMYRWARVNGGKSFHCEVESKDSSELRLSMLNYDKQATSLLVAESLESWMKHLSFLLGPNGVKRYLDGTKDKPGPGRTIPIIFGIDSLMAKASEENLAKIESSGFSDRQHPLEALKISSYLKYLPQQLAGYPFFLAGTNHLKPQKSATGSIDYKTSGGYAPRFMETLEFRLSRVADIKGVERNGVTIKFVTAKNSLGPSRKSITADFLWYLDKNDNYRQKSFWDWNSSTVALLTEFKGSIKEDLDSICDMQIIAISGKGKYAWSNALGIPRSDPVPYATAGAMLEQREDLLEGLHRILGVRTHTVFKPGVSYDTQLAAASLAIENREGYIPQSADGSSLIPQLTDEDFELNDEDI